MSMFDRYNLQVIVPDDKDEQLFKYLADKPFRHSYINSSSVEVNLHKILLENLPAGAIEHTKQVFRDMFIQSQYVRFCSFQILTSNEFY